MAKKAQPILNGAFGSLLCTEDFRALYVKLASWRRNPTIKLMVSKKSKGRILDFVKGLRISAQLAYIVRQILSTHPEIEVSWGHLVDSKGASCSPECDIIVHKRGCVQQWNGGQNPIMDFKFINCELALCVISCKSFAKSVDYKYCDRIAEYGVNNVMLFAECCAPGKAVSLKKRAQKAGYSGFYYLYEYDEKSFTDRFDEPACIEFIEAINSLI